MTAKQFYKPRRPGEEIATRKELFDSLNRFSMSRNGWVTSIPGAPDVKLETLPDSTLPDELIALGYDVREIGEGQRILPHAITGMVITATRWPFSLP